MSLEHSPTRQRHNGNSEVEFSEGAGIDHPALDAEYWYALIDEKAMAEFLGVTHRSLQKWRQTGEGPKYVAISARCVKYRRVDGREYSEARLRSSTSDPGPEANAD